MFMRLSGAMLTIAVTLTACGGTAATSPTPSPTPSATPFVAPDAGFSAVFPATPQRQTQNINETGVSLTLTLYVATTNDEQVAVAVEPLPTAPQAAEIQSRLEAGVAGSAQKVNGQIVSKSQTRFLGQPAEDAAIQAQGTIIRERIFFVGRTLYFLEGITSSPDAKHPAYDKLLATFKTI